MNAVAKRMLNWESMALPKMLITARELIALVCVQVLNTLTDMKNLKDVTALSDCGEYKSYLVHIG